MDIAYQSLTWANFYKDFSIDRVLLEVSEAGFKGVEFVEKLSLLGSPNKLKSKLKDFNLPLVSLSCGLNLDRSDKSDIRETIDKTDYAKEFGVLPMMVCGGWLSEKRAKREDDFKILAGKLEECSEHAGKLGMSIAYHPHKDTIVETESDIDRLLKYTKLTKLCIDIAHLTWCGSDPVKVIEKNKDKITYIHLKDWSSAKNSFVELGKGDVDIINSVNLLIKIKYKGWMTVELDNTSSDPKKSAQISAEFLKKINLL